MTYSPLNINVYTAAYAGATAGVGIPTGAFIIDPLSNDYGQQISVAVAFAQAVDTAWGAVGANAYDIEAITDASDNLFARGPGCPIQGVIVTQSNWTIVATALVALIRKGDSVATAGGIVLPPINGTGTFQNLSNVIFVDGNTLVPQIDETGNIETPFGLMSDGITAVPSGGSIYVTPLNYSSIGTVVITKNMTIKALGIATFSSITIQPGITAVTLENITCTGTLTVPSSCTLTPKNCIVGNQIVGNDCVIIANNSSVTGNVSCGVIVANNCSFTDTFFVSGSVSVLSDTTWLHPEVFFTGSVGSLSLDGVTYNNWLANSGVIFNGSIRVINSLPRAVVPVPLGTVGNESPDASVVYVDVNVSTTQLNGILQNTPIAANPTVDLAPGATGGAACYVNARVSAFNTVRLTFITGTVSASTPTNFIITQLAAN